MFVSQDLTLIFEVSGCKDVPKNSQVPGSYHRCIGGFLREKMMFRMQQKVVIIWEANIMFFFGDFWVIFGGLVDDFFWGYIRIHELGPPSRHFEHRHGKSPCLRLLDRSNNYKWEFFP